MKNSSFNGYYMLQNINNIIENGSTADFIEFAKRYNIFQKSNSKFYDQMVNKIKQRLDREGLNYDIVKPE